MKSIKNRKIIYIVLSIAVLIANILPIIIFRQRAAITIYSIPSLVFAFCSTVYAIVAISLRKYFNLFFLNLYILSKMLNKSYNKTQEYKEDFIKFAFIYCATIPTCITLSLFADNFYLAIIWPLEISILRDAAIILIALIPLIVRNITKKQQQHIKDEAYRKEQERRESMGEWK